MYKDKVVKSLKVFNNSILSGDLTIGGTINCPKLFTITYTDIFFKHDLSPSTPHNLGQKKNPWNIVFCNEIQSTEINTFKLNVFDELTVGRNYYKQPLICAHSSDGSGTICDYLFFGSIVKIGYSINEKKDFYLNPYEHISYLNTNSFSINNYNNNTALLKIDTANLETNFSLHKINILNYPTIYAVSGVFTINVAICSLASTTPSNPFIITFTFTKPTYGIFYNLKNPINIKHGNNTYSLVRKIEYHYDPSNNNLIII